MEKKFHRIPSPRALFDLEHVWAHYLAPFRIAPHVYSVGGNIDVAVYLLDTGDGLALIDTGMTEFMYLIVDSIHRLGFDPWDIKKIFLTHGHGDHINGARLLQEMTGAEIWMSAEDERFYQEHPIESMPTIPFTVQHHYQDDASIKMGRFTIRTRLTPGHTPGTTSFFFEDTDEETGKVYRVAMHGGVGADMMKREYLQSLDLPEELAHRFIRDCEEMAGLPVEICLPSHFNQVNLVANIPADPMDYTAFTESYVWPDLLTERAGAVRDFYPEVYGK